MNRRRCIVLGALLAVAGVAAAMWLWSEREPSYHGKRLSEWVAHYGSGLQADSAQADEAVRAVGTNAIPVLLRMLHTRDSDFKRKLIELSNRQSFIQSPFKYAFVPQRDASFAFRALGPEGIIALPELIELSRNPETSYFTCIALAWLGPESIPTLRAGLTNQAREVKYASINALGFSGSNAVGVLPDLIALSKDADNGIRGLALETLGRIGQAPALVVPVLVAALQDPDINVRFDALESLTHFGPLATSAAPAIQQAMSAPDNQYPKFLKVAHEVLQQVAPTNRP